MDLEVGGFIPRIDGSHRFAVAVPAEGGKLVIIQTYEDIDELGTGFRNWGDLAELGGLTPPVAIELGESGQCQVIDSLGDESEDS